MRIYSRASYFPLHVDIFICNFYKYYHYGVHIPSSYRNSTIYKSDAALVGIGAARQLCCFVPTTMTQVIYIYFFFARN